MPRPVAVDPRPDFHLWLKYDDGTQGEVDLSDVGGRGVFACWAEPGMFEAVHIGERGDIVWDDALDLCADSLYERISAGA